MEPDRRKYARDTRFRLVIGFVLILFMVGDGLIYVLYGQGAAVMGLLCLAAGLIPVLGVGLFFWLANKILERNR